MRITKRQLRRIIREAFSTNPLNAQLGGKIGNPYGGDMISLVRSLNNAMYSLDQGYDQEEIDAAEETLARVKEEMSPQDFEIAKEIADLFVFYSEYAASPQEVRQVESELEVLCSQLGIEVDDIV